MLRQGVKIMFQFIGKIICHIFGHNWVGHVVSGPRGGATTTYICSRCGKITKDR